MAYIDTCAPDQQNGCAPIADHGFHQRLYVRTIKAWLGGGGCIQALTTVDHVLAVGNIACDFRSSGTPTRCVIPISTTDEVGGPKLRFIEGEIKDHDGGVCFVRAVDPPTTMDVLALGTPGAAFDGYSNPGRFVGSYVPGFTGDAPAADDWSRLFRMSRDVASGWLVPGSMVGEKAYPTNYWPISVGSITRATGETHVQWRAISY